MHLEISRFVQKHPVPCSPAFVLCAVLSRVRGPTIQPMTPVLGQIHSTKSTRPPLRRSRYRYIGSVAWQPSESEKPRTPGPECPTSSPNVLAVAPQPGLPLPCPRFQDGGIPQSLHATLSRVVTWPLHGSQPSGWRCLRHGIGSSHGWRHNTCAALEQWVRSNCLIMFLNGTGEPFFKSSPGGCSGFHRRVRAVNGRGGVLPGVK